MKIKGNQSRTLSFLLAAIAAYVLALVLLYSGDESPIQTVAWKLGHVMLGAYSGYWIDRIAFRDRIHDASHPQIMLRRAIVIAAAMFTLGTGM